MTLKTKSDAAQAVFSGLAAEESRARGESTDSWVTLAEFNTAGAVAVSWHLECITNDVDARIVMLNGNSEAPVVLDATANPEATASVTASNSGYVWARAKGSKMLLQIQSATPSTPGVIVARGYKGR